MNATLQCLCQIEKLVDNFRMSSRILKVIEDYKNKREDCLTDSFKYLIENICLGIKNIMTQNIIIKI